MAWRSLDHFLAATPPDAERTRLPTPEALLELASLNLIPPGTTQATLRNVSFWLEPGKALGVIGKSGSGKTTLAKALLGLIPPIAGEIRLGGAMLDQYDPTDLGHHIGYLPQQVTLFKGTIAVNIARLSPNPDPETVVAAARQANAHEMILKLPKGYDTVLDGNDSILSGGQKQRIGLARALYGDPVVLILDEPNSALDGAGTEALNAAIRELKAAGKSAIIMTHRPQAIAECDDLIVLEQGHVVRAGPGDDVLGSALQNAHVIKRQLSTVGG